MSLYHSRVRQEKIEELIDKKGSFLFLGAAGVGMSALCEYLVTLGIPVRGIDKETDSASARRLEAIGVPIMSESEEYTPREDGLVYSLAVRRDSPHIARAEERGIPCFSRAQLLGAIMKRHSVGISVSGSHGKSTTVAMLSHILTLAGKNPSVISGASLSAGGGSSFRRGSKELLIAEACEYKNSFLYLKPSIQVLTDIELDHTDFFPSLESLKSSFLAALKGSERAVVYYDSKNVRDVVKRLERDVITYGASRNCIYRYSAVSETREGIRFRLCDKRFTLRQIGSHNVRNATAATAVAELLGVSPSESRDALESFVGIGRRLELLGKAFGSYVYYDYAHHPTEMRSTVESLKRIYSSCAVVFKPHTYSRTKALFSDFVRSLRLADRAAVLDIYAARERDELGVSSRMLAEAVGGGCEYVPDCQSAEWVRKSGCECCVIMGAGDVGFLLSELGFIQ